MSDKKRSFDGLGTHPLTALAIAQEAALARMNGDVYFASIYEWSTPGSSSFNKTVNLQHSLQGVFHPEASKKFCSHRLITHHPTCPGEASGGCFRERN